MARIPQRGGNKVGPVSESPYAIPSSGLVDQVSRAAGASLRAQAAGMGAVAQAIKSSNVADVIQAGNLGNVVARVGDQLGGAVNRLADQAQRRDEMRMEADNRIATAKRVTDARVSAAHAWGDLQAAQDEVLQGDPSTAFDAFQARRAEIKEQYREKIGDEQTFSLFEDNFETDAEHAAVNVRKGARKGIVDGVLEGTAQASQQYQAAALAAKTPADRALAVNGFLATMEEAVGSGAMTRKQAEGARQKWFGEVEDVEARRLVDADPVRAQTELSGDRFANLSPERRQSLIEFSGRLADARANDADRNAKEQARNVVADANERMRWAYADMSASIDRGEAGLEDVEKFREQFGGFVGPSGTPIAAGPYNSMREAVLRRDKQKNIDADREARITDAMQNGGKVTPGDADFYYQRVIQPKIAENPDAAGQTVVGFAKAIGMVPSVVTQGMGTALGSKDVPPEARLQAAKLAEEIGQNSPKAYETIPLSTRTAAEVFLEASRVTGDPAEAARIADGKLNVPEAERKAREGRMTNSFMRQQGDKLRRDLSGWFNDYGLDQGPVFDAVATAFGNIYRDAYVTHGDEGLAYKAAKETVEKNFGPSGVDGANRFMFLPPEKTYGVIDHGSEDAAWMRQQLAADVKAIPGIDPARVNDAGVYLVSDPRTRDTGTYRVVWRDSLLPVYSGDGTEMRWAPDWATSPKKAEMDAATAAGIEDARQKRAAFVASGGAVPAPSASLAPAIEGNRKAQEDAFRRTIGN